VWGTIGLCGPCLGDVGRVGPHTGCAAHEWRAENRARPRDVTVLLVNSKTFDAQVVRSREFIMVDRASAFFFQCVGVRSLRLHREVMYCTVREWEHCVGFLVDD
jgi:hypothetical protein